MFKNALGRFRFMGFLEGSSLLLLLFIAMPLKYWFGMPSAVTIVGTLHGYIFLAYMVAIVYAMIAVKWPFKFTIGAVLSAFIPFGNFILDSRLKTLEKPSGKPL
jgi:integral membrane protein